jgi:hypothetical protein
MLASGGNSGSTRPCYSTDRNFSFTRGLNMGRDFCMAAVPPTTLDVRVYPEKSQPIAARSLDITQGIVI